MLTSGCIPTLKEDWTPAANSPDATNPDAYEYGNCESLAGVFRNYGATEQEIQWFVPKLDRESGCGRDVYNERTGDTGVCQLTGLHARKGYFFGKFYQNGWASELFGLSLGKANGGADGYHPATIPACLWLLRGGGLPNAFGGKAAWNMQR